MGEVSPNEGVEVREDAPMTQYDVNFFKPRPGYQKDNMKLITLLVIIWAVAVFGFQFLLIILQKPTPEPGLQKFKDTWGPVVEGKATGEQYQAFARVNIDVLGKNIMLKPAHKEVLKKSLSAAVMGLIGPKAAEYKAALSAGDTAKAGGLAIAAIGLEDKSWDKLRRDFVPYSIVPVESAAIGQDVQDALPGIMDLYLIHNRSFLTDFEFLGFPFHYWFTAQFLLILFVLLCLLYAVLIDKVMIKYGRMTKDKKA